MFLTWMPCDAGIEILSFPKCQFINIWLTCVGRHNGCLRLAAAG